MTEFNVNGIQVYDYEGKGFPLIFIHAFPLSSKMWQPQIDFFNEKYRVITYDVRGLGKSKSLNNQFTMECFSDDLLMIIEHLKLEKVFACGLSMGGYILLRSYMKNPGKFKGLVLADTRAEKDDDTGLINRSNNIEYIKKGKRDEFFSSFYPKLVGKNNLNNEVIKSLFNNIIKDNSDEGICGALLALATRINAIDYLKSFNIPTLILVGEDDELTPYSVSEKMKNLIPDSVLRLIQGAGHLSNIENSKAFNSYIIRFLQDNT
ncbi:MAG: alpha/beta hydrolase [Ignavibacteria bacterium]|jgi:pimeloyl-ACP methyl ester carboxylesterase